MKKDIQFFAPQENPSVFNPQEEAEIKRRRKLAEAMMKASEQSQGTEMVSGVAVKQSPLSALAKAIQGGMGAYQESKADKAESDALARRQQMMAEAIKAYGQNPAQAAEMLGQDPRTADMAFKIMMGEIDARRDREREGRSFAQQKELIELRNKYDADGQMTAFEQQKQMAKIENDLAIARQQNNAALEKQLLAEKERIASIQTAPRKLSSTEQKELFEAQEKASAGEGAIGALNQAKRIYEEKNPYTGFGAEIRSDIARIPGIGNILADRQRGAATTEAKNLISQQALESLKSTFGGNPTEGERQVLLQLQALPTYTPEEQKAIISNAINAAERRKSFELQKQYGIQTGGYAVPQLPNSNVAVPQIDPKILEYMTPEERALFQ